MTVLDWVLLTVWFGVTLAGFWKGAMRFVLGGGGVVAGVWLAVVAGADIAHSLAPVVGEGWLAQVIGAALPLLLCVALGLVAGWGFERTLKALHLGWLNRLAGALLAGLVAAVLLAVLVIFACGVSPAFAEQVAESRLVPFLSRALGLLPSS